MQRIDFDFKNLLFFLLPFLSCNTNISLLINDFSNSFQEDKKTNFVSLIIKLKDGNILMSYTSYDGQLNWMNIKGLDEIKIQEAIDKLQPVHGEKVEIEAEIISDVSNSASEIFTIKRILTEKKVRKISIRINPQNVD